jgi:tetratricopeptide (TPR) repeat protein
VRCYIEDHHPPDVMDRRRTLFYFLNLANQATKIGWENGQNIEEILSRKSASIDYLLQKQLSFHNRDDALYAVRVAIAYGRYQRFAGVGTYGLLEQAAEVAQTFNEKSLQAACHLALGSMKVMRSLPAAAKIDFETAKALYITQRDIFGIAHCLRGLGYVELVTFNYAAAKTLYEDAKRKYESAKDEGVDQNSWALRNDVEHRKREIERGIADCTFRIGTIIQDSTLRHDEADSFYKRAFHIHERIGDVLGHAHCLKRLADVAMSKYSGNDAEQLYKNANELYRKVPYLVGMADCAYSLGDLFFRRGEIDAAEAYYADASHLYTRASADHGKVNCLYSQADIDLCHIFGAPGIYENEWKRLYDIERKYQRARSSYESLHDGIGIANCDSGLSDIKHLQGDEAAAENLLGRAHELVRRSFNKDEDVLPAMALENGRLRRWRT